MPEDALPSNLHEFITRYVSSLEQLEILLLVSRSEDTAWTVQSVYDVVLSNKSSVERWLDELARFGFVTKTQGDVSSYRFSAPDATAALIKDLGQLYKTKPVRVIEAIFRANRNPAQSFADSFRLKPKE